jgi:hypothetical protein
METDFDTGLDPAHQAEMDKLFSLFFESDESNIDFTPSGIDQVDYGSNSAAPNDPQTLPTGGTTHYATGINDPDFINDFDYSPLKIAGDSVTEVGDEQFIEPLHISAYCLDKNGIILSIVEEVCHVNISATDMMTYILV